ncbi:MAG: hypothetical protein ACOX5G_12810 [Kiritimatiellia bacterium]
MKPGRKSPASKQAAAAAPPPAPPSAPPSGWIRTAGWAAVSFTLSLLSSAAGGRALWCDEILRIKGQHYPIADLLALKHLVEFCTQTPTAYLFMRPFQLLFGYEWGGCLVSALSAAVITAATLRTLRALRHGAMPGWMASSIVATNPLLVYYGSELGFYEMWSAAFACAFALLATRPGAGEGPGWRSFLHLFLLAVAGSLFVTFHFAGLFVWVVVCAVALLVEWVQCGLVRALQLGIPLAIPVLVNLQMYLDSQGKAIHLGTRTIQWAKASGLPKELARYAATNFPSFTGGWIAGVAVCLLGIRALYRRKSDPAAQRIATLCIASILAVAFFLSYSALRDYMPNVARYWIYALAPVLVLTGAGVQRCVDAAASRPGPARLLWLLPATILAGNVLADTTLVLLEGRLEPYRKFQKALEGDALAHNGLLFPNHYEARFLGDYYALPSPPDGTNMPVSPCYWEQGRDIAIAGIRAIHGLSPLLPVYVTSEEHMEWVSAGGIHTTNAVFEVRPPTLAWTDALHLFPEVLGVKSYLSRILLPTMDEAVANAEATHEPLVIPGPTWGMSSLKPRSFDEPFTPCLYAKAGVPSTFEIYFPATWEPSSPLFLELVIASESPSSALVEEVGGETGMLSLSQQYQRIRKPLAQAAPGTWVTTKVTSKTAPCAILSAQIRGP